MCVCVCECVQQEGTSCQFSAVGRQQEDSGLNTSADLWSGLKGQNFDFSSHGSEEEPGMQQD